MSVIDPELEDERRSWSAERLEQLRAMERPMTPDELARRR